MKYPVPIPLRKNSAQAGEVSSMNTALTHYERRSVIAKAMIWGLLVGLIGMSIDDAIRGLRWPWFRERLFANILEGTLFTVLVWVVLSARDRRLRQRFKEVGTSTTISATPWP